MQFLKTLFWVLLAVLIALFARGNWVAVPLKLWDNIQVDINLPLLMAVMFLLGFLPTFVLHRARLWTMKRRLEVEQRQQLLAAQPVHTDDAPVI